MTDIVCALCSKTFKTESGRRWHVDHLHQLPSHQDHGEINTYEQSDEATDEVDSPLLEVLEQPVDAVSDRTTESRATAGTETLLADAVGELSEEVAGLGHRLEELQVEVGSSTQTRDLISESQTKMSSLESRLSRLDDLIESLTLLVWTLDKEHEQPRGSVSLLGPDTSPKRLAAARETLQAAFPSSVIDELLKTKPWTADRK